MLHSTRHDAALIKYFKKVHFIYKIFRFSFQNKILRHSLAKIYKHTHGERERGQRVKVRVYM